jgi:hypothetical protein
MADYAIQAVLGGASSVIAWMLDDNSHPNFEWGLWKNKENGMKLRPWFYTWSLLTKYFPAGSKIYNIKTNSINSRAMAGRIEKFGKTYWTYCIVNLENVSMGLTIIQKNETEENFARYIYQEGERQIDENGFPIPVDTLTINLLEGKKIECLPNSVTFLTTYLK